MAQPGSSSLKVLEHCQVSPPPDFIPQTSLPFTFFDLLWLPFPPVERLFFYTYNHTNTYFMNTTLPNIKHSLSLTLQHFFPLAARLTWPTQSTKPQIDLHNSSIMLTVAESNLIFDNLVGTHSKDANDFYPLVPKILPSSTNAQGDVDQVPVMALQVTLFPNTGVSIGISTLHVIGDGKTTTHFMKSWASVCKSGLLPDESHPFYDRTMINDPHNLEALYLKIAQKCFYKPKIPTVGINKVRVTFILGRCDIQKIKGFVLDRFEIMNRPPPSHVSTFVLTCAYVWVCLVKVLASSEEEAGMEMDYAAFPMDCRERLNPPLPTTYFGNCLMPCLVDAQRNDLLGENGIAIATEEIGNAIHKMLSEGVLEVETLFAKSKFISNRRYLSIAGSPKFGVYGTNFGWGTPKKVDVVSIDSNGAVSLSERRDGEGGIQIGMVMNKLEMDAFTSLFTGTLKVLS